MDLSKNVYTTEASSKANTTSHDSGPSTMDLCNSPGTPNAGGLVATPSAGGPPTGTPDTNASGLLLSTCLILPPNLLLLLQP